MSSPNRIIHRIGFTLIELLVVLTLIAVLAGSVVVSIQGREDQYALRVAAEDFSTALRFAVQESDATGQPHRVIFDHQIRTFWVESQVPGEEYSSVEGIAGKQHMIPEGVVLRIGLDNPLQTEIQPLVYAFGPGIDVFKGEIIFQNTALDALRIVVLPDTGQVRIIKSE